MTEDVLIGYKNGLSVYVKECVIAEIGISKARRMLGLSPARYYPIKTSLSGHFVNVEADSHAEALQMVMTDKTGCK